MFISKTVLINYLILFAFILGTIIFSILFSYNINFSWQLVFIFFGLIFSYRFYIYNNSWEDSADILFHIVFWVIFIIISIITNLYYFFNSNISLNLFR